MVKMASQVGEDSVKALILVLAKLAALDRAVGDEKYVDGYRRASPWCILRRGDGRFHFVLGEPPGLQKVTNHIFNLPVRETPK
jgi:hypothetical protein